MIILWFLCFGFVLIEKSAVSLLVQLFQRVISAQWWKILSYCLPDYCFFIHYSLLRDICCPFVLCPPSLSTSSSISSFSPQSAFWVVYSNLYPNVLIVSHLLFNLGIEFLVFMFSTFSISSVFWENILLFLSNVDIPSFKSLSTINLLILYLFLIIQLSVVLGGKICAVCSFFLFIAYLSCAHSTLWVYVCSGFICQDPGQTVWRQDPPVGVFTCPSSGATDLGW